VLQQHRLRCYGHVVRKDENNWVKKYMELKWKVQDLEAGQRKLGSRVTETDCQTRQICKEDAMDRRKWRKLIKDVE